MWCRLASIVLLSGVLCSQALAAADVLSDFLDKGREASKNGKIDEAERYIRLAVASLSSETEPARQAEALGDLGGVLLLKGHFDEARVLCLQSLDLLKNTKSRKYLPIVLDNLGELANQSGDFGQAEKYLKEAIRVAQEISPDDPYVARLLNNLGVLYYMTGNDGGAEKSLKEAIAIAESRLGKDRVELVPLVNNLGEAYVIQKKWSAARTQFERAFSILESNGRAEHIDAAAVFGSLGRMHLARKNFVEAAEALRRSYAIRVRIFGPEHPSVATTEVNLAAALANSGGYEEAERLYTDALKVLEKSSGARSIPVATTLEQLTELYQKTHREDQAALTADRAKEIRFELQNVVSARSLR